MFNLEGLPHSGPSILPEPDEKVRDYFTRILSEKGSFNIGISYLRQCGVFYEVKTDAGYTEEMEEWVFDNTEDGAYYCTDIFGGPCSWFFNDKQTAAIFKLAYGK